MLSLHYSVVVCATSLYFCRCLLHGCSLSSVLFRSLRHSSTGFKRRRGVFRAQQLPYEAVKHSFLHSQMLSAASGYCRHCSSSTMWFAPFVTVGASCLHEVSQRKIASSWRETEIVATFKLYINRPSIRTVISRTVQLHAPSLKGSRSTFHCGGAECDALPRCTKSISSTTLGPLLVAQTRITHREAACITPEPTLEIPKHGPNFSISPGHLHSPNKVENNTHCRKGMHTLPASKLHTRFHSTPQPAT